MKPAIWSRLSYRAVNLLYRQLQRGVRILSELPVAFYTPALERYSLDTHYDQGRWYRSNQDVGLYPFEERAVTRYFPAPPARLLIPGAGGGREMAALARRGYLTHGFDPVPALVDAAAVALRSHPGATVARHTLQGWATEVLGRGASEGVWDGRPYDGIVNGWGMWTHILRQEDRLTALRAFRLVCPSGVLFLSFHREEEVLDHEERGAIARPLHPEPEGRIEKLTRGWLRQRVLGLPPVERGTRWVSSVFLHSVSERELEEEAAMTGWRVVYYERNGSFFPHAVLQ